MTDNVEAGAVAPEAAPAAFKTKAVPSAIAPEPEAKPEPKPEKVEAKPEPVEDSDESEEDTEEAAASDGSDAPARPKNKGVGKRINELTREKHDALRELEYWKQQALKTAPADQDKPAQAAPIKEAEVAGEPKLEDFDFDTAAFNRAHYRWMRDEERKQEAIQRVQREFVEKEKAFEAENPDYREVAYSQAFPMTHEMVRVILETDNPPAIAYYLGKNPDEAAAIAQMQPIAAARAIGRIEAKLSATPAPATPREPPKKTTNAPPPPKTVSGAGKPEVSVDDPNITTAQRIALWKARRKI